MFYPRTERQEELTVLAEALAAKFAGRAAEHDRTGTFPHENFADLRAAGLPALVVPTEFGGWGGTLLETVMVVETLARGDGSTALSMTMHMQTLGEAAETRSWPPALFAEVCAAIVERGALINSVNTEPELGSPSRGGKPKTVARPVAHGGGPPEAWIIDGHKSYASLVPELDYLIVAAVLEDGSEDVARFVAPKGEGVTIVETWKALGMRATGSHDVLLQGVRVPHANMLSRSDAAKPADGGKVNAWFLLTVSAVYLGVAAAALQTAAYYAHTRTPTALGKPIATLESIQRQLGEAELALSQARLLLYHTAELWDRHPGHRPALGPAVAVAKVTATNHAIVAVDHCMRAVGGAAMTRALPLERYYRDVRAGLYHPINDDQALLMLGQLALREAKHED